MKFLGWLLFHTVFICGLGFLYCVRFFLDIVYFWARIIGSADLVEWCQEADDSICDWLDNLDDDEN